jgi:hypothetical protein
LAEQKRQWQRERWVYVVLIGIALATMLGTAFPTYRFQRAESVYAELTGCDTTRGNRVRCTAQWSADDGRRCRARVERRASTVDWLEVGSRKSGRDHVRVDGCDVLSAVGPGFFSAMLIALVITGPVWAVRHRRRPGSGVRT